MSQFYSCHSVLQDRVLVSCQSMSLCRAMTDITIHVTLCFQLSCQDPRSKGMPISSYLLKPMQRITKYPLILQNVSDGITAYPLILQNVSAVITKYPLILQNVSDGITAYPLILQNVSAVITRYPLILQNVSFVSTKYPLILQNVSNMITIYFIKTQASSFTPHCLIHYKPLVPSICCLCQGK